MSTKPLVFIGTSSKKYKDGTYLNLYRCFCDATFLALARNVTNRKTVSCGCYRKSGGSKPAKGKTPSNALLDPSESSFNGLYSTYKHSAERKDLAFELSKADFRLLTKGSCHYCGEPPASEYKHTKWARMPYVNNGIDRKNNNMGYTVINCVSCCSDCNYLKGAKSYDEFINKIIKIALHVHLTVGKL